MRAKKVSDPVFLRENRKGAANDSLVAHAILPTGVLSLWLFALSDGGFVTRTAAFPETDFQRLCLAWEDKNFKWPEPCVTRARLGCLASPNEP